MEASSRPVRVLVVEDDDEIAQVLQRALRLEGYDVKLAADGGAERRARGLRRAAGMRPDRVRRLRLRSFPPARVIRS